MASTLRFHGPYGLTRLGGWPLVETSAVADQCGIYLWTAELPDRYRVAYVGKADGQGGFRERLKVEVRRYLKQLRGDKCYDVPLFRQGKRKEIPPDVASLQGGVHWSPIFLAPISCNPQLLLLTESAIIRRLRINSPETRAFLANNHCRRAALPAPVQVTSDERIVLEGLQEPLP